MLQKFFAELRRRVHDLRMADKPNPLEPTDADLDIVTDEARREAGYGPVKRSPAKGIADMEARIVQLTAEKKSLLNQPDFSTNTLDVLNGQLKEAAARLADYQLQAKSLN